MAIITETSPAMSDAAVRSGASITFTVVDPDDKRAVQVAAGNGRETPNLRDRVFVVTILLAERSDGRSAGYRETTSQHLDATNYVGLNENAIFAAIKIVHDVDQAREGLA